MPLTREEINAARTATGYKPIEQVSTSGKSLSERLNAKLAEKGFKEEPFNPGNVFKASTESDREGIIPAAIRGTAETYSEIPGKITEDIREGAKDIEAGVEAAEKGNILEGIGKSAKGTAKAALRTAGDVAGAVFAPVASAVGETLEKTGAQGVIEKFADFVGDKVSDWKPLQEFAMKHPNAEKDFERVLNLLMAGGEKGKINPKRVIEEVKALPAEVVSKTKEAASGMKEAISQTVKDLTTKSEQQIDSAIVKSFEKGVKPTATGKKTASGLDNFREDVVSAVRTINENKPNLSFMDESGQTISGQNPKTLKELSEAVEQTKKSVFKKYNTLAETAGDAGVKVQIKPIASELDQVINNQALSITNPSAIDYASKLKERLTASGDLDAMVAQDVIQNYNKSLEAFYRNPSYDNASKAAIDAMVANNMRKALDDGISGLTGAQYQALKNQYGALKSIENDVIKAAIRDARRSTKGLIDFSDVFSGGQVINGILTLNPTQIATGLTQKGISEFYKFLNNPNRAIAKMFDVVEKSSAVPSSQNTPQSPSTPQQQQ